MCYTYRMRQQIFVSNRLAVRTAVEDGQISFIPSVGGLATGLSSVAAGNPNTLWVGWSGVANEDLSDAQRAEVVRRLQAEHAAIAVELSDEELQEFYAGFCNDTIWPLFHYFPTYAEYDAATWASYQAVNQRFFEAVMRVAEPDATIWVHDYQLMLLPGLLKQALPDSRIGFFLHIPFPSYELFRLLPWREQLLQGVLGSDLIGFHTYDYARHFLSSVRRLLGYDHHMAMIQTPNRTVKVDVFPMGIDWERFAAAGSLTQVQQAVESVKNVFGARKLVFSVDRLDYSKGIPTRLRAFRRFLEQHPEMHGEVVLFMIVSPSRENVARYIDLKHTVDGLVSEINGQFSRIDWTPIHYQYQTASFETLGGLYRCADVLLVTPLRDGMNLVVKEYVAARTDGNGAVVLSETAGVARELSEAHLVNPNDVEQIAQELHRALTEPAEERRERFRAMQRRLSRYTVQFWAKDFLEKLEAMPQLQAERRAAPLTESERGALTTRFAAAKRVLLILDYDGTLVRFFKQPHHARPDHALLGLLGRLSERHGVEVVLSSGRDRADMERWFGEAQVGIGAGHGAWIRRRGGDWEAAPVGVPGWKESIRSVIERTVDRTPGSLLEEKEFSLAWHYRNCEPELAAVRLAELRDTLISLTSNLDLSVLDGNRVIEVKPVHVHKGRVVQQYLEHGPWDLVVAVGDDTTDEYMFMAMPDDGVSIKVGTGASVARYSVDGVEAVRGLLEMLESARSNESPLA